MNPIASYRDEEADHEGVERFRRAMLEKLKRKRAEGRRGWNLPAVCSIGQLETMLREHVEKGDAVDVANLAMMIWNRRNPTGTQR